jgi:hypothetical protein
VAFDRAARVADGFIFFGGGIDHAVDAWKRLRDRVGGLGRSVEDFGTDSAARRRHISARGAAITIDGGYTAP